MLVSPFFGLKSYAFPEKKDFKIDFLSKRMWLSLRFYISEITAQSYL
jgi:hypothetical protein